MIREAIKSGEFGEIVGCAQLIEEQWPVAKTANKDGKEIDTNREPRNKRLTKIRMPMRRICENELQVPILTIEKVAGQWTVKQSMPKPGRPSPVERKATKAIEYVLAHLDDPIISARLHEAGYSRIEERAHVGPVVLPQLDTGRFGGRLLRLVSRQ